MQTPEYKQAFPYPSKSSRSSAASKTEKYLDLLLLFVIQSKDILSWHLLTLYCALL